MSVVLLVLLPCHVVVVAVVSTVVGLVVGVILRTILINGIGVVVSLRSISSNREW